MPGKRYKQAAEKVDNEKEYPLEDAVFMVQEFASARFNETIDLAVRLGIDPQKSDQAVRGSVSLPAGLGTSRTVLVFAEGEDADDAEEAGADYVGGEELAERIEEDEFLDFDVALAAEYAMRYVGPIGRILGPKGLMPSPKDGTIIPEGNFGEAVEEFKKGRVEFRSDSGGNIHVPVGKEEFSQQELENNIRYFMEHLKGERPAGASGRFFRKVVLSKTMSPGVKVDPAEF